MSAQIRMGFSVLNLHSCGQQFKTKIKISKFLVKFFKQKFKDFWKSIIISFYSGGRHYYWKRKAFSLKFIHKTITAIERNCRNFDGGHLPYFFTLHFLGLPYLTERSSVCDFDRTVKSLLNDSQIIATYAEVLKCTVKFNVPQKVILKVMIPNLFCPVYYGSLSLHSLCSGPLYCQWNMLSWRFQVKIHGLLFDNFIIW